MGQFYWDFQNEASLPTFHLLQNTNKQTNKGVYKHLPGRLKKCPLCIETHYITPTKIAIDNV